MATSDRKCEDASAQNFELVELDLAFVGGHVAGDEVGAQDSAGAMLVADPCHDLPDVSGERYGAIDAAVEADDALDHSGSALRNHLTKCSNCLPRLAGSASRLL